MKYRLLSKIRLISLLSVLLLLITLRLDACTRAVYLGSDNTIMTGRSMDCDLSASLCDKVEAIL